MKGFSSMKRIAMQFAVAAFAAIAERARQRQVAAMNGNVIHDPSTGREHARGGPGTRATQRAAQKRRNVQRNRLAHRG